MCECTETVNEHEWPEGLIWRERHRIADGVRGIQQARQWHTIVAKGEIASRYLSLTVIISLVVAVAWLVPGLDIGARIVVTMMAAPICISLMAILQLFPKFVGIGHFSDELLTADHSKSMVALANEYVATFDLSDRVKGGWKNASGNVYTRRINKVTIQLDFTQTVPVFSVPKGELPEDQRISTDVSVLWDSLKLRGAKDWELESEPVIATAEVATRAPGAKG